MEERGKAGEGSSGRRNSELDAVLNVAGQKHQAGGRRRKNEAGGRRRLRQVCHFTFLSVSGRRSEQCKE